MNLNNVNYTIDGTLSKLRVISESLWLMRTASENEKSDLNLSLLENFLRSLDMSMDECVRNLVGLSQDIDNFLNTKEKVKQEVRTNG